MTSVNIERQLGTKFEFGRPEVLVTSKVNGVTHEKEERFW